MRAMRTALLAAAALVGCAQPSPDATNPAPSAIQAAATASPVTTATSSTTFHCFTWTRDGKPETNCYSDLSTCQTAEGRLRSAARETQPCVPHAGAFCTVAARTASTASKHERCFADSPACEDYRRQSEPKGFTAGPCEAR